MRVSKQKKAVTANTDTVSMKSGNKNALKYINMAIESLGEECKESPDNEISKEAIANLGVVLLDLMSAQ